MDLINRQFHAEMEVRNPFVKRTSDVPLMLIKQVLCLRPKYATGRRILFVDHAVSRVTSLCLINLRLSRRKRNPLSADRRDLDPSRFVPHIFRNEQPLIADFELF
jgi:hypothetical protein